MSTLLWTVSAGLGLALVVGSALVIPRAVREARSLRRARRRLEETPSATGVFDESLGADLPEPARRYLRHAIAPGTPVPTTAHLHLERRIRTRKTVADSPFLVHRIEESITTARGSVGWGRVAGARPPTTLSYWYVDGESAIQESPFGLVPLRVSRGRNTNQVMRSRILNDYLFHPAALLPGQGARWEATGDEDTARVVVAMDEQPLTMELRVDADGRLLEATCLRWGSVGMKDRKFTDIPFGCVVDEEGTFGGITIPTRIRSGWWYGTERYVESIVVVILDAVYR